jgi:hypothetical protein
MKRQTENGGSVDITLSRRLTELEKAILIAMDGVIKPNKEYDENYDDNADDYDTPAWLKRSSAYRFKLKKLRKALKRKRAFGDVTDEELETAVKELFPLSVCFRIYEKGEWLIASHRNLLSFINHYDGKVYLSFVANNVSAIKKTSGVERIGKALSSLEFKEG